jgi:phosphoenolpyruvate carboxykinase (ATP)
MVHEKPQEQEESDTQLPKTVSHHNLSVPALCEAALARGEGRLAAGGALVVDTGRYTGRSPKDKYVVKDALTENRVDWGEVNQAMSEAHFAQLDADMRAFAEDKPLFVQDLYVGADETYQAPIRVITEYAWHSLFAHNMFVRPSESPTEPVYTVLDLPSFHADPAKYGCRSETVIALNLSQRRLLVGGTEYAGEIKKSIFSAMNFELPAKGVMPMHCSASYDEAGQVALFFGLSGTGKTTLSADPKRTLIGDDEHAWSDEGIFNFEGGCYAKAIHLNPQAEPEIYATTHRFGTILENVSLDETSREVDFDDGSKTQNTRLSYPIDFIQGASPSGMGGHPQHIVLLTADAFGVLPPIAKLSLEQALYYFLSGYTAKVAGTERGVSDPQATFSACFGAPFMPLKPSEYALLLGKKLAAHKAQAWLVNTGWSGGPYGVGARIELPYTRAMVKAALAGELEGAPIRTHPVFGLAVPERCPGVPTELLDPKDTWRDPAAYGAQAAKLSDMFKENFETFAADMPESVRRAGPA